MIKAVLFDMDGVLINSEHIMLAAAKAALKEFGVDAADADFTPFIGAGEEAFVGGVARMHKTEYVPAMKARTYEIYGELIDPSCVCPRAKEIVLSLKRSRIPAAVCSSAGIEKIRHNLRAIGLRESDFGAIVSAGDITRNKPDPEIYIKGARMLEVKTCECVIVEDTVNGVAAARRAPGAVTVAVGTTFGREDFLRQSAPDIDHFIDTLAALPKVLDSLGLKIDAAQ